MFLHYQSYYGCRISDSIKAWKYNYKGTPLGDKIAKRPVSPNFAQKYPFLCAPKIWGLGVIFPKSYHFFRLISCNPNRVHYTSPNTIGTH